MRNEYTNVFHILVLINYLYLGIKSNHHHSLINIYNRNLESTIDNSITLIINGPGENINILSNAYSNRLPNEIFINGIQASISKKVNLAQEGENIIILKWNDKFTNDISEMFANCGSIISIDLSKMEFDDVTSVSSFMTGCNSLKFVNLTNINLPKIVTMWKFFNGCTSLTSVDFTNFRLPYDGSMSFKYTFKNCRSLISLDLSFLNIKKTYKTNEFFRGTTSLILLDLSNFDTSIIIEQGNEFTNCNKLKFINLRNFIGKDIFQSIPSSNNLIICMNGFEQLNDTFSLKQRNVVNNCSNLCFQKPTILNVDEKRCYYDCPKLNENFCNYDHTEILNIMPEGFFLNDTYGRTIDKCFSLCKHCIFYGDSFVNNCTECISGFNLLKGSNYKYNCYEYCEYYYFNNVLNIYKCREYYSLFIDSSEKEKNEMIDNLDFLVKDKEPSISYIITGDEYSLLIYPIGRNIEDSQVLIDFSICEKILKEKFPNYELRMALISINKNGQNNLNKNIEYKIYNQFGETIDLSYCKEVNITIQNKIMNTASLNLEQIAYFQKIGVDILNIDDDFFNDICYSFFDRNTKSDMILKDRVSDIYPNISLCDEGCEYESIDLEKLYVNCTCKIKQKMNKETKEGNLKTYISKSFLYSNFGIIKCYKIVFGFEGKLENLGFWIFGVILLIHIPVYIIYCIKGIDPIKKYIHKEMNNYGYKINETKSSTSVETTIENLGEDKKIKPIQKKKKIKKKNRNFIKNQIYFLLKKKRIN